MTDEQIERIAEKLGNLVEIPISAVRDRYRTVLNLIQDDPHQWSCRPCQTCKAVSELMGPLQMSPVRSSDWLIAVTPLKDVRGNDGRTLSTRHAR